MYDLDPTVVSPSAPSPHIQNDPLPEEYGRRGFRRQHYGIDSPLLRTSEQEWLGLNNKTRACLPLELHESYLFSGAFEQARQTLDVMHHECGGEPGRNRLY